MKQVRKKNRKGLYSCQASIVVDEFFGRVGINPGVKNHWCYVNREFSGGIAGIHSLPVKIHVQSEAS